MQKQTFEPPSAPKAVGPYSIAVSAGELLFISGQMPINPKTGQIVEGSIAEQARQVLENLKVITEECGSSLEHVVKVTVFLTDMTKFSELNEVYATFFTNAPPARAVVEVRALPKGVDVEMEAIAIRQG
ncbi:MAG TPA: RidA family protein [Thermotogota bacterium]|nr:RidA family protein [Thermotogota bacterium]HRW92657.1 RidA family protein [Thermotogota bacterium]